MDYSQCVRLVQQTISYDGGAARVADILSQTATAGLLSNEGAICPPRYTEAGLRGGTTTNGTEMNN